MTCERALVTLLRGLGPWRDSIYLVGGLAARYLTPAGPSHAGTLDVDVVVDVQLLVGIDAYRSFEDNLRKSGFAPVGKDGNPAPSSWRWQYRKGGGDTIVLELLTDDPEKTGGQVQVIPGEGAIQVLNIPRSSIVFDHYQVREIRAELLDGNGIVSERVRHTDLLGFTCLKALAVDQRFERKDAYDLIYCIEHADGGLDALSEPIRKAREGKHGTAVEAALRILRKHLCQTKRPRDIRRMVRWPSPSSKEAKESSSMKLECGVSAEWPIWSKTCWPKSVNPPSTHLGLAGSG